jgi:hypothetical protein
MVGRYFDHTTYAQAFSMPGIDPRVWVSMAIVDIPGEDSGDSQTVEFDEDDGQLYVNVTLKPMDTPLRARVGMLAAGSGEAVYFPFCGGEEVLVAIPEGNMRSGAVVICRMNNAYDGFPFDSVGGADPKQNAAAMLRTRTALTIESGASVLIRSAAAGAMLALSGDGTITLRDAKANVLQMSPDVFGFQTGDGSAFLQMDLTGKRFNLQIGDTTFTLAGSPSSAGVPYSALTTPTTFVVASGGTAPDFTAVEHVLTTEALVNILCAVLPLLFAAAVPPVAWVPPPPNPASPFYAQIIAGIQLAATAGVIQPTVAAALQAAFLAAAPKPPGLPGVGQVKPGIGCPTFIAG